MAAVFLGIIFFAAHIASNTILAAELADPNFRIFADRDAITVFNAERFVRGTDIQEIFERLDVDEPRHAFYLGKELARASLAQLGLA